jgi:NADPH2:quinone reductase
VKLPDTIGDRAAAAALLKGMTAHYLLEIGRVKEQRPTILVHAAAGGVGLILCQHTKHLGATVIGPRALRAGARGARAARARAGRDVLSDPCRFAQAAPPVEG